MWKGILIIGLAFLNFVFQGCNSAATQAIATEIKSEDLSEQSIIPKSLNTGIQQSRKVEYKGVSFSYNPQIFGKVEMEEVAEYPLGVEDNKPDGVEPQHRLFTFDLSTEYSNMYIAVYPVNDFPRMYALNKESMENMKQDIINLKKVLKDKNFRVENEIPFLRFYNASQTFQQKVKFFPFQDGNGILFLTFWETQVELPSNRQLRYIFEGLTSDEKYYVLAEMPVSVAFLPKDSSEEYEGYKIPWGKLKDEVEMKRFKSVKEKIGRRLENLPTEKYDPNLKHFEEIISSLKIEK